MITFKVTNKLTGQLKKINKQLSNLPKEALKEFINNTPIRTGNARRNTKLKGKNVIHARYPYAQRLDEGYSKQSPDGMSKPTEKFIQKRIKQILSRRGR
jgi:polyisoprenoid-binding protein YceI